MTIDILKGLDWLGRTEYVVRMVDGANVTECAVRSYHQAFQIAAAAQAYYPQARSAF